MQVNIKKLVMDMTLEEKASFISGSDFWHTEKIERLGIPSIMMSDGPCGLRKQEGSVDNFGIAESIKAVSYPTGSCIACSFDRDILRECGETLGIEARAEKINILLGPAVNIKRSPLCGRNFEYFSEDPYLSAELACAYIRGLQSKGVAASVKHFAANSKENRRLTDSSDVDERTLREIYFPAFEAAVKDARVQTVMCSYNRINGEYASENEWLLKKVLRDEWGFDGFVVSDWGSVNDRVKGVAAGLDLEMPGPARETARSVIEAVKSGKLDEEHLDRACENILNVLYKVADEGSSDRKYDIDEHHAISKRIADESVVLLKNDDDVLPLSKNSNVAFIGQFAKVPRFQGGGSSRVNSYRKVSALDALEDISPIFEEGYRLDGKEDEDLLNKAVSAASEAEYAVLFVGTGEDEESEGFDRNDLSLSRNQTDLINSVSEIQKNVIVVVHAGSCIEMPWIDKVKGVIYAYMGGEAIGETVVDILFGDVNPSGRLAETFPLKLEDNPSYIWFQSEDDHTAYNEGIFVGYRWYDKTKRGVLFPFGHGLSYTKFEYSDLILDKDEISDTQRLNVSMKIRNIGNRSGKEVVQLYVKNPGDKIIRPVRELRGFEKVFLDAGEEKTVTFVLDKRSFSYYDAGRKDWAVEEGEYYIEVGTSSRKILLSAAVKLYETNRIKKHYTLNSTVGDILSDEKAADAFSDLFWKIIKSMDGIGLDDVSQSADLEKTIRSFSDQPLRNINMVAGDIVSLKAVEEILKKINTQ